MRYTAKLADGTVFDERLEGNELTFTIDDGEFVADQVCSDASKVGPSLFPMRLSRRSEQLPEGVDLAVQKMKAGERNLVTIQPDYGFGAREYQGARGTVPPNSTLTYDITLVSFKNVS